MGPHAARRTTKTTKSTFVINKKEFFMMHYNKYFFKVVILSLLCTASSTFAMIESIPLFMGQAIQKLFNQSPQKPKNYDQLLKDVINPPTEVRQYEQLLKDIKEISSTKIIDEITATMKHRVYDELLKELEHITKKPYDDLKKEFDEGRRNIREFLQCNDIQAQHDPNMPLPIYHDLIASIAEENINPNNIALQYNPDPSQRQFASARSLESVFSDEIKPTITTYHKLCNESKDQQYWSYKHEISHLLLHHFLVDVFTWIHVKESKEKIKSIKEREADLHAAKNAHLAFIGAEIRCDKNPHRNIIDPRHHCTQMDIMRELMEQREMLIEREKKLS
jgi:hypothetical protein